MGCVPSIPFGKPENVADDIEREFIAGIDGRWFSALDYNLLPGDRLERQRAWITVAGQLGTCHADEIHRLGVRNKGRLVIPDRLKEEAKDFLERMGRTRESLGFAHNQRADEIAAQISEEFFPLKE